MKIGDLVTMAEWCRDPGELGIIIDNNPYSHADCENRVFVILVAGKVWNYHLDDFYDHHTADCD